MSGDKCSDADAWELYGVIVLLECLSLGSRQASQRV